MDDIRQRAGAVLAAAIARQLLPVAAGELETAVSGWERGGPLGLLEALVDAGVVDPEAGAAAAGYRDYLLKYYRGDAARALQELRSRPGWSAAVSWAGQLWAREPVDDADGAMVSDGEATAPLARGFDSQVPERPGPTPMGVIEDDFKITSEHPDRYTIKSERGRGASGRVLVAFDGHIGREVALKELLPDLAAGAEAGASGSAGVSLSASARFLREARITGQLEHPGIVPVYEIGRRPDGSSYYTMRLVRGRTLADRLKEVSTNTPAPGRMSARLHFLHHFLSLCQAVGYAHSRGVIHRDLKPANVMIGEFGEAVVLDWGLAKMPGLADARAEDLDRSLQLIRRASVSATARGAPLGTPCYMSPEQARGRIEEIDERSDVWALGAMLFEIVAGRPPFLGRNAGEVMDRVVREEAPSLLEMEPGAPVGLADIVGQCLTKDRERRYADAGELARELEKFQADGLLSALAESYLILGRWSETRHELGRAEAYYARSLATRDRPASRFLLNDLRTRAGARTSLERTLSGHEGSVRALAFCGGEDRTLLASAGEDREIKVWDLESGEAVSTLSGHTAPVRSLAYSPEARVLGSASADRTARIWDPAAGRLLHTLAGHEDVVEQLTFSPDGRLAATASWDFTVKVWEVASGRLIHTLTGHAGWVKAAAFSPDGTTLATASADRTARTWDPATGRALSVLAGHGDEVDAVVYTPDGRMAATAGGDRVVRLWSAPTGELLHALPGHAGWVRSLAVSPDGQTLASGSLDGTVRLWETATGRLQAELVGHTWAVTSIGFSPDGSLLASESGDHTVKLWDPASAKPVGSLEGHEDEVDAVAFSPDGRRLVSAGQDRRVMVWAFGAGPQERTWEAGARALAVAVSRDGWVMVGGSDGRLRSYDADGRERFSAEAQAGSVTGLAAGGDWLATAGDDGRVRTWDQSGNAVRSWQAGGGSVAALAADPDGRLLATASADRVVRLWDPTGALMGALPARDDEVHCLAFGPGAKWIYVGGADGKVRCWDAATGRPGEFLAEHGPVVSCLAVSEDGRMAASGGWDKTVALWDLATGGRLRVLEKHRSTVSAVAFSPDGGLVASASWDGTVKVWETATGDLIKSWKPHTEKVSGLAFSPDRTMLVSVGGDRRVAVWPLLPEVMAGEAGKILEDSERRTGLKVKGLDVHPVDPQTGRTSERPLPRAF